MIQDDLLRIFGGEKMQNLMLRLGMEEDVPIESKMITNRIRKAQEAVEAQNFEARKHLLEYDDVNNKQRQTVYGQRRQLLEGVDRKQHVMEMMQGIIEQYIDRHSIPLLARTSQPRLRNHWVFAAGLVPFTKSRIITESTVFSRLSTLRLAPLGTGVGVISCGTVITLTC